MTRRAPRTSAPVDTERLLWTAAIVVGATVPHWNELSLWVLGLLAAAVSWRLGVAVRGWRPPGRSARLLFAFVAFCGVLFQYRTINGVAAGSALLVVMVALKFLESQNRRDQLVLIMISYFLMFASLLTERSPVTALYVVALVWVTTVALLQLGRRGALLPGRVTAGLAGGLLLKALPVMVVLFVLFPRLPGPLWAIPAGTGSGATGLNDTMSPGDITNLGLSDEVAFRVEFFSPVPAPSDLYWRGPSMTTFNGRTWSMLQGGFRGERVADTIEYRGAATDYRVMLEPNGRNWAFALDMPASWSTDRGLRMGSDYQLGTFFGASRSGRLDYRVTSYTAFMAKEPLTAGQLQTFRALPPDSSPRARALVADWLADDPSPRQIIERASGYLREQPFRYTLTPPPLGSQPVDEFLFETREGFCEHYASAFTVLMRAAGIPARVVTGYQGGELNNVGRYYIIRQSDAHAWTEVWLEDTGWTRIDPVAAVAPERLALGSLRGSLAGDAVAGGAFARLGWVRRSALLWDAVNTHWQALVVGYGPELQRALLETAGFTGLRRAERWATLLALAAGATFLLLAALSLLAAWRHRQRRRSDPAARCFAAFCRRLSRARVPPRAVGEGPAAYAARAARLLPHAAAEIAAIAALYLHARYEPDTNAAALHELARRVASFRPARA